MAGLRAGFETLDADDSKRMVRRTATAMHAGGNDDAGDAGQDMRSLRMLCNRIGTFKDKLIDPTDAQNSIEAMVAQANATRNPMDAPGLWLAGRVYVEHQRRLKEFAASLRRDVDAIQAALDLPWDHEPGGGRGKPPHDAEADDVRRAGFKLLRARVRHAV